MLAIAAPRRLVHSRRLAAALGLLALGLCCGCVERRADSARPHSDAPVERLHREGRSGVVVESAGIVERVLSDDVQGSRHQRFVLRLGSGHTVLVSHNIDLAPRIAGLRPGDEVAFRGQYEWNERGGVVHWTHHDPQAQRPGGWLRHAGRTYR